MRVVEGWWYEGTGRSDTSHNNQGLANPSHRPQIYFLSEMLHTAVNISRGPTPRGVTLWATPLFIWRTHGGGTNVTAYCLRTLQKKGGHTVPS